MSANKESIFELLAIEPTANYLTVLHHYIDRINPNNPNEWWKRPTLEAVYLHFCLINNEAKFTEYYTHYSKGHLDLFLSQNPVPKTMAEGARHLLTWIRAKVMEQELLKTQGLNTAPEAVLVTATDTSESEIKHSNYTRYRFMPTNRRPPTRPVHDDVLIKTSAVAI